MSLTFIETSCNKTGGFAGRGWVVMATGDAQHSPQHRGGHQQPGAEQQQNNAFSWHNNLRAADAYAGRAEWWFRVAAARPLHWRSAPHWARCALGYAGACFPHG